MLQELSLPQGAMESFCRKWKISRLELFGHSRAGGLESWEAMNFVYTVEADNRPGLAELVLMERELEQLVGRKVDLIERQCLANSRNYIRRQMLLGCAEVVCVA